MSLQQPDTTGLFALFDDAQSQFVNLISSFNEKDINNIPFQNSWTAAQVAAHVAKANTSVAELLSIPTKTTDRKPDERADELKKIFLNFTVKFQSQQAILPTQEIYRKEALLEELETSFKVLKESGNTANLPEVIQHHALGETTKLEMIYLAAYHTLRHVHQLREIYQILKKDE